MYFKYVENVIPLSKSIGLLFLFCLPLLSISFFKTKRNDLARPVMGTIFLVQFMSRRELKSLLSDGLVEARDQLTCTAPEVKKILMIISENLRVYNTRVRRDCKSKKVILKNSRFI